MDRVTIAWWNIARYKRLIATETDEVVREMAERLIAEKQAIRMFGERHVASSLERILASQQDLERVYASLDQASDLVRKSREAVRKSKALLSMRQPRPQPLVSPEQEMERWRIAIALVQKLNDAGYGCQLSSPAERAS